MLPFRLSDLQSPSAMALADELLRLLHSLCTTKHQEKLLPTRQGAHESPYKNNISHDILIAPCAEEHLETRNNQHGFWWCQSSSHVTLASPVVLLLSRAAPTTGCNFKQPDHLVQLHTWVAEKITQSWVAKFSMVDSTGTRGLYHQAGV